MVSVKFKCSKCYRDYHIDELLFNTVGVCYECPDYGSFHFIIKRLD